MWTNPDDLTNQEIFDKTFAFIYNQGPAFRSWYCGFKCAYLTADGKQCAVGLWLENPPRRDGPVNESFPLYITKRLHFFKRLQEAHDTAVYRSVQKPHNTVSLDTFRREYVNAMTELVNEFNLKTPTAVH